MTAIAAIRGHGAGSTTTAAESMNNVQNPRQQWSASTMGDPERLLTSRNVDPVVRDLLEPLRCVAPEPSASLKVWLAMAGKIAAVQAEIAPFNTSAAPAATDVCKQQSSCGARRRRRGLRG